MKVKVLAILLWTALASAGLWANPVAVEKIWPEGKTPDLQQRQSVPEIEWWIPERKTSRACLIVAPGGGYGGICYPHEGALVATNFCSRGVTVVVLKYRVPRPAQTIPFYKTAWQDAQRAVRIVRSRAAKYDFDADKVGMTGFSAGGHLTLLAATSSRTPAYAPVDALDKTPCNLNFAIPVYPAYVLNGGKGRGAEEGVKMVGEFAFDAATPSMCLIHGDDDPHSALGSVRVYERLRAMKLKAELHVLANVNHGFGGTQKNRPNWAHCGWELEACRFMAKMGIMPFVPIYRWD